MVPCLVTLSGFQTHRASLSASAELLVNTRYRYSLAVQCIVIGAVCGFATGGRAVWVCYRDNSKLHASILTKLGL